MLNFKIDVLTGKSIFPCHIMVNVDGDMILEYIHIPNSDKWEFLINDKHPESDHELLIMECKLLATEELIKEFQNIVSNIQKYTEGI